MSTLALRDPCRFRLLYTVNRRFRLSAPLIRFLDADIVCSRAKNHYDPLGTLNFSDSATQMDDAQALTSLESFRKDFKPLHGTQAQRMYFSVRFYRPFLRLFADTVIVIMRCVHNYWFVGIYRVVPLFCQIMMINAIKRDRFLALNDVTCSRFAQACLPSTSTFQSFFSALLGFPSLQL